MRTYTLDFNTYLQRISAGLLPIAGAETRIIGESDGATVTFTYDETYEPDKAFVDAHIALDKADSPLVPAPV